MFVFIEVKSEESQTLLSSAGSAVYHFVGQKIRFKLDDLCFQI